MVEAEPRISTEEFRALRRQTGLTQQQVAVLAGASTTTVEGWESGRRHAPHMLRVLLRYYLQYGGLR